MESSLSAIDFQQLGLAGAASGALRRLREHLIASNPDAAGPRQARVTPPQAERLAAALYEAIGPLAHLFEGLGEALLRAAATAAVDSSDGPQPQKRQAQATLGTAFQDAAGLLARAADAASVLLDQDSPAGQPPPSASTVAVALRVSGGEHDHPAVGVVRLGRGDLEALLAEIDLAAGLRHLRPELVSLRTWDGRVRYSHDGTLADGAFLEDVALGGQDWAVIAPATLAQLDLGYRSDCDAREVTADDVVWTGYPRHGDVRFVTASLSRQALAGLLARLAGTAAAPPASSSPAAAEDAR